jgi:hypothetical protein
MVRIVSVTVYGNQWSRDLIEDASGAHHVRRPPSCPPATGHALLTVGLPGTCRHCDRYTFAFAWRLAARASRARTPGRTLNGARLSRVRVVQLRPVRVRHILAARPMSVLGRVQHEASSKRSSFAPRSTTFVSPLRGLARKV